MTLPHSTTPESTTATTDRITMASASQTVHPPALNPWEARALNYIVPDQRQQASQSALVGQEPGRDTLIHPGLYSGTGFDLLSILVTVRSRPHPSIDIGAVDCSVALVVCDMELPDSPIVYASNAFCELTGYSQRETLGRNCRFLQTPGPGSSQGVKATAAIDKVAIQRLRQAVQSQSEIQLQLYNYKRNGQRFTNILSIIPIQLPDGHRYSVGFQSELE